MCGGRGCFCGGVYLLSRELFSCVVVELWICGVVDLLSCGVVEL